MQAQTTPTSSIRTSTDKVAPSVKTLCLLI
jgi:hypothetical protein